MFRLRKPAIVTELVNILAPECRHRRAKLARFHNRRATEEIYKTLLLWRDIEARNPGTAAQIATKTISNDHYQSIPSVKGLK